MSDEKDARIAELENRLARYELSDGYATLEAEDALANIFTENGMSRVRKAIEEIVSEINGEYMPHVGDDAIYNAYCQAVRIVERFLSGPGEKSSIEVGAGREQWKRDFSYVVGMPGSAAEVRAAIFEQYRKEFEGSMLERLEAEVERLEDSLKRERESYRMLRERAYG